MLDYLPLLSSFSLSCQVYHFYTTTKFLLFLPSLVYSRHLSPLLCQHIDHNEVKRNQDHQRWYHHDSDDDGWNNASVETDLEAELSQFGQKTKQKAADASEEEKYEKEGLERLFWEEWTDFGGTFACQFTFGLVEDLSTTCATNKRFFLPIWGSVLTIIPSDPVIDNFDDTLLMNRTVTLTQIQQPSIGVCLVAYTARKPIWCRMKDIGRRMVTKFWRC